MKVTFVSPRYGLTVYGGAEWGTRQLAERLASQLGWSTEVLTTCALDYTTWTDVMPEGTALVNGVIVHRFRSVAGRSPLFDQAYAELSEWPQLASLDVSRRLIDLQGPLNPAVVDAARDSDADVVVFYPYLYYPTVRGIGSMSKPAILHPAAHDEPVYHLPVFKATFRSADALVYHSVAERRLVEQHHPIGDRPQLVLGLGVDRPPPPERAGGEVAGLGDRPYLVSVGRVDAQKGSLLLVDHFAKFKARHPGPLALVLVGPINTNIPPHPDLVITGPVDEQDKAGIVQGAMASVSPSPYESFSLVVMESAIVGVPVMVNSACPPTREFCERSGGGLAFGSYAEFEVILERLLGDRTLREHLGAAGRRYVEEQYNWPTLISRYAAFLTAASERRPIVTPYRMVR